MQIDMHYYGVYALGLLAGLNEEAAEVIATASQYVDDSVGNDTLDHQSGAKLIPEATAHHTADVRNLDRDHQRFIWIPFHFLPGNKGEELTERLVCRKDSELAQKMVSHHLGFAERPFALELMGVTAHVYADTFAHYGFSGVSSRRNKVVNDEIELLDVTPATQDYWNQKSSRFFRKYGKSGGWWRNIKRSIFSAGAEMMSGALGHGAVLTFPDQPYLHWKYTYEDEFEDRSQQPVDRENQKSFLEGCSALYGMFQRLAQKNPRFQAGSNGGDFNQVEDKIRDILAVEDGKKTRAQAWCELVRENAAFGKLDIKPYQPSEGWTKDRNDFPALENPSEATEFSVFRFYQASSLHRHYVLRELLPEHGLIVI